jgi:hypothetical protein
LGEGGALAPGEGFPQAATSLESTTIETTKIQASHRWITRQFQKLKPHWPIILVLALFAATAFVVPTLTPVATTDDWGYTRSVEILYHDHELTVFPVVAATAVFQIGWGTLFAILFGMTLGVMRVATLVMVSLGALALYALLRELGLSRGRSALGTAAYLFNPLTFILSYTFMTDPYFTSLLIGSSYFYIRGLRPDKPETRAILIGSLIAACAFLTRQQGALIPFAVVIELVITRRLWFNRASIRLFLKVVAIPVFATIAYYLWLHFFNNVPSVQQGFFNEAKRAGVGGAWRLTRFLSVIELMYLGFFTLPVVAALIPGLRGAIRTMTRRAWIVFGVWAFVLWTGLVVFQVQGRRWPYIPQFVGAGGLGPPDVLGSRPRLFTGVFFDWATLVCAIAAILLALFLSRGVIAPPSPERAGAGLLLVIGLWQVVGILPPSFHYLRRGYSLDRYLLPLLPIGICLLLWASRDLRLFQPLGWAIGAVFLVFSVAATRDYLVYLDRVWQTATEAHEAGVDYTKLDAGAAWDGYHLYTYGLDRGMKRARTKNGPWWMTFYGLPSDSSYVVSAKGRPGYVLVWQRAYNSWLLGESTPIFLLRKTSVPGPP